MLAASDFRALFQFSGSSSNSSLNSPNKQVRVFEDPVEVGVAASYGEVLPLLERVDEMAGRGFYAAGFLTYEAGLALDKKRAPFFRNDLPHGLPLAAFGFFRGYREEVIPPLPNLRGYSIRAKGEGLRLEEYLSDVEVLQQKIARGEIYQINYTFFRGLSLLGDPYSLYCDLAREQPGYGAFFSLGQNFGVSLSPELFFEVRGGRIKMKPMKGTIGRGGDAAEDEASKERLRKSEKDLAENTMIVDLIRNDLGRICRLGGVRVESRYEVETYPTLHQMTSTVSGELRVFSMREIFSALFPSGSITGAPKEAAMGWIREYEKGARGLYTGAIGFVEPGGDAVFNVAIRTLQGRGGEALLGVGSGVVYDSQAEAEYRECLLKSRFLYDKLTNLGDGTAPEAMGAACKG